jgi:hypothetical protein
VAARRPRQPDRPRRPGEAVGGRVGDLGQLAAAKRLTHTERDHRGHRPWWPLPALEFAGFCRFLPGSCLTRAWQAARPSAPAPALPIRCPIPAPSQHHNGPPDRTTQPRPHDRNPLHRQSAAVAQGVDQCPRRSVSPLCPAPSLSVAVALSRRSSTSDGLVTASPTRDRARPDHVARLACVLAHPAPFPRRDSGRLTLLACWSRLGRLASSQRAIPGSQGRAGGRG